jgi:nitroreductase
MVVKLLLTLNCPLQIIGEILMSEPMDLLEAIYTTRTIRRFTNDPVPPDLLRRVLEAATQAPSGINRQPWRFIILEDPGVRRKASDLYREGYVNNRKPEPGEEERNPSVYFAMHMADAPVLIVVCGIMPPSNRSRIDPFVMTPPGVYAAAQNLLLAARAFGLGGTMTTNHRWRESELKELLGVPEPHEILGIIPMGYPAEKHGPKTRLSVEEVTARDHWDTPMTFSSPS